MKLLVSLEVYDLHEVLTRGQRVKQVEGEVQGVTCDGPSFLKRWEDLVIAYRGGREQPMIFLQQGAERKACSYSRNRTQAAWVKTRNPSH